MYPVRQALSPRTESFFMPIFGEAIHDVFHEREASSI